MVGPLLCKARRNKANRIRASVLQERYPTAKKFDIQSPTSNRRQTIADRFGSRSWMFTCRPPGCNRPG